jgi:hypothetical protein
MIIFIYTKNRIGSRAFPSKSAMALEPIVIMLPFGQQAFQVACIQIYRGIKLCQIGLLRTFCFPV